jgi:hypothetical protein
LPPHRTCTARATAACGARGGSTGTSPQACPERSGDAAPGVAAFTSAKAAVAYLHYQPAFHQDPPDLADLAKELGPAFFVDVHRGYVHGSDVPRFAVAAVFVEPKRITVVPRLVEWSLPLIDAGMKAPHRPPAIAAIMQLPDGEHRHVGHLRISRGDRVEDHFIDLDTSEEIRAVITPPAIPFEAFQLTAEGFTAGADCNGFWDD